MTAASATLVGCGDPMPQPTISPTQLGTGTLGHSENNFAPDVNLANILLQWVNADFTTVSQTAGSVDQWNDKSPGAKHYTATSTTRPAWHPADLSVGSNDGSLPGRNYMHFDGTDDYMVSSLNLPAPGTTPTWGSMIVRPSNINAHRIIGSDSAQNVQLLDMISATTIQQYNGTLVNTITVANVTWLWLTWYFSNSTSDYFQVQNRKSTGANAGNGSANGRRIASDGLAAKYGNIDVWELIYTNALPSALQISNHIKYLNKYLPANIAPTDLNVVFEGDSNTANTYTTCYPNYVDFGGKLTKFYNVATGGDTSANVVAQYSADVDSKYNAGTAPAANNIALLLVGTNDLVAGTSPATTYSNIQSWCSSARGKGFRTIVCTVFRGAFTTTPEANRLTLNASIRNGAGTDFDFCCDLASLTIPGTLRDGVYWLNTGTGGVDGDYHPTILTHQTILAPLVSATIKLAA